MIGTWPSLNSTLHMLATVYWPARVTAVLGALVISFAVRPVRG